LLLLYSPRPIVKIKMLITCTYLLSTPRLIHRSRVYKMITIMMLAFLL